MVCCREVDLPGICYSDRPGSYWVFGAGGRWAFMVIAVVIVVVVMGDVGLFRSIGRDTDVS